MKVTIELEPDQIDTLVKSDLRSLLDCLESDLERVQEDQKGYVFVSDWQKDAKEIEEHIRAFRKVLRYYGEDLQECVDETAEREHEPVVWVTDNGFYELEPEGIDAVPLYTAPPKREWVGLTKEEMLELFEKYSDRPFSLMLATHDKVKEKNLG
jgi:hypothetical protein